ncbi:MAG: MBL fold metallo-hydrolase, partial [SAR324 cluster bacterium]|nr:MBL fold metallo-hydrolase [SAR324 cluster bacterium]
MVKVKFLGAAGTVTGSQFLVEGSNSRFLIDSGMFQGSREWRAKNRIEPLFDVKTIDAVLLTHAHIDHIGLLPRLYTLGLQCPVYCSAPTASLAEIILQDSSILQKEEAEFRRKSRRSRYENPEPLYTMQDVQGALSLLQPKGLDEDVLLPCNAKARFSQMGHILGASSILLEIDDRRLNFSGDVGRFAVPVMRDPSPVNFGKILCIEATYGGRTHAKEAPEKQLSAVINETVERGGLILIPSFAIGRAQVLLYYLRELKEAGSIPNIPIIVDSPMAIEATSIYKKFPEWYDEEALKLLQSGKSIFEPANLYFIRDREESKRLNPIQESMIIIAGNGMLNGGRILHHLFHRLPSPKNTVLLVGYQPEGGRGYWLKKGVPSI